MKVRTARLGMLAFAGGHTLSLLLAFLPDIIVILGSKWTTVILAASIMAMVPFIVSDVLDGFLESGVRGLLGAAGFAFIAMAAFVLALFYGRPEPDAIGWYELMAYGLPALVLCLAFIRYRDRASQPDLAARPQTSW
jgi:hypothetical protein